MSKILLLMAIFTLPFSAMAQSKDFRNGTSTVRLSAGGHGLAGVYGLEYERRAANQGLSVFGSFISRRSQTNQVAQTPEQWALGIGAPIHLVDNTDFDVFISPEIAVTYTKDNLVDGTDITSFGPGLRIGTMYAFNPMWSLGFEFTNYTNWFNDKIASNQTSSNLTLGFSW